LLNNQHKPNNPFQAFDNMQIGSYHNQILDFIKKKHNIVNRDEEQNEKNEANKNKNFNYGNYPNQYQKKKSEEIENGPQIFMKTALIKEYNIMQHNIKDEIDENF
jgi:hypothetical protein